MKKISKIGRWFVYEIADMHEVNLSHQECESIVSRLELGEKVTYQGLRFAPMGDSKFRVYDVR